MSSEDPKMTLHQDSAMRSSKPYIGITVLVLSLLLGVTVAALIYQSVTVKQVQTCQQQTSGKSSNEEVDIRSTVTINTDDNKQVQEKINYSQTGKVAYYYGDDGSFDVEDFGKGLHITRDPEDGVCYVIAVGASNASEIHDFEKLIRDSDGSELTVHNRNPDGQEVTAKIIPGEIQDTSFIPQGAHKECTNGYQWMSFITQGTGSGDDHDIEKRQTEDEDRECLRARCIIFPYRGFLWRYCYCTEWSN